jgi:hypothetical protein
MMEEYVGTIACVKEDNIRRIRQVRGKPVEIVEVKKMKTEYRGSDYSFKVKFLEDCGNVYTGHTEPGWGYNELDLIRREPDWEV